MAAKKQSCCRLLVCCHLRPGQHAAAVAASCRSWCCWALTALPFLRHHTMFLQVGSKNAGFFMGSSIKVATKRADELYVHELCLAAADLEARYQAREVRRQGGGW